MLNKVFDEVNRLLAERDVLLTIKHAKNDLITLDLSNLKIVRSSDVVSLCYEAKLTREIDRSYPQYSNVKNRNTVVIKGYNIYLDRLQTDYNAFYSLEGLFKSRLENFFENEMIAKFNKAKVWKVNDAFILLTKVWSGINKITINRGSHNLNNFNNLNLTNILEINPRYLNELNLMQPVYLKELDIPSNLDTCDAKDLNKVWVVRKGENYGAFEVDDTEKQTFAVCGVSNYILTGLSNYFNERTQQYNGSYSSFWVVNTAWRCTYSGNFINNASDVVRSKTGLVFSKSSVKRLKELGVDDLDFLNKDYSVQSYGSTPSLNFEKFSTETKPLYLGVELEVDSASANDDDDCDEYESDDDNGGHSSELRDLHSQVVLSKIAKGKKVIFSKTDGSLNYGFEMVSHPMTLAKHTKGIDWKSGFDTLTKLGYRSHNTSTCGLHVHINRDFFGSPSVAKVNGAKIAYLLEKNKDDVVNFTRRTDYLLNRWARFGSMQYQLNSNASLKTRKMIVGEFNRYYPTRSKYIALNTMHKHTFEFRIFRGTLNYGTFLATLQLVDNIAHIVRDIPNNDDMFNHLDQINFDDIVNFRPYVELTTYWNSRKGE
jgi:hypothetical protein